MLPIRMTRAPNTCRFSVVFEHFTQDQLVWVFAKWITEHGRRDQVHVTVGTFRLIGAGAIKVPLRQIYGVTEAVINQLGLTEREAENQSAGMLLTFDAFRFKVQRSGFATEPFTGSVDPNVHGLDFVSLREFHVLLLHSFTQGGAGRRGHRYLLL